MNSDFLALENINLTIEEGQRVALLGKNGAGKTTLLRVLAGIFSPTYGTVDREGTVSALLTAGIAMNPDASAYENILLTGLLLGIDQRQINDEVIPDVEEFTELGKFMSMPMRTYSTGMEARLAFAISTAIQPEILLMDENLGAGDAFFVEKARARINKLLDGSSIIVLASHNLAIIEQICQQAIVLKKGKIEFVGDIGTGIEYYQRSGNT